MIPPELKTYVQTQILPRYQAFDGAHQVDHAQKVIQSSLALAQEHGADEAMAYVIAAYHDLGLAGGRDGHEVRSAEILMADHRLSQWFTPAQLNTMAQAAQDHRASNQHPPRSLYGRIVAEADRDIRYLVILRRTLQYGLAKFPHLSPEEQFDRTVTHIQEKYGHGGYLKLWLDTALNRQGLEEIRARLADMPALGADMRRIYSELTGQAGEQNPASAE